MERKEQFVGWLDIARGVGSLIVDEAVLGVKAIFRMPRLFSTVSEHTFEHPLDTPTPLMKEWGYNGCDSQSDYLNQPDDAA